MVKTCTCYNMMWVVDQNPDNHLEWPYGSLILWPHLMARFIVTPLVAEILITFNTLITFQPLKRNRDRNRPAGPARAVTELVTHRGLASALLTTITNW